MLLLSCRLCFLWLMFMGVIPRPAFPAFSKTLLHFLNIALMSMIPVQSVRCTRQRTESVLCFATETIQVASLFMWQSSCFIVYCSLFMWQPSCFIVHCSLFMWQPSCFIVHCSLFMWQPSCFIVHCSLFMWQPSCFIVHCSCGNPVASLFIVHCSCGNPVASLFIVHCSCGSPVASLFMWQNPGLPCRERGESSGSSQ